MQNNPIPFEIGNQMEIELVAESHAEIEVENLDNDYKIAILNAITSAETIVKYDYIGAVGILNAINNLLESPNFLDIDIIKKKDVKKLEEKFLFLRDKVLGKLAEC